jgi:hypothetical protein
MIGSPNPATNDPGPRCRSSTTGLNRIKPAARCNVKKLGRDDVVVQARTHEGVIAFCFLLDLMRRVT